MKPRRIPALQHPETFQKRLLAGRQVSRRNLAREPLKSEWERVGWLYDRWEHARVLGPLRQKRARLWLAAALLGLLAATAATGMLWPQQPYGALLGFPVLWAGLFWWSHLRLHNAERALACDYLLGCRRLMRRARGLRHWR
jgi:hypothetical protein